MRWFSRPALLPALAAMASSVIAAEDMLTSTSLVSCLENSNFYATQFDIKYTPHNNSMEAELVAISTIEGNITFHVVASAYGYEFLKETYNPCEMEDLRGFCPMSSGELPPQKLKINVPPEAASRIPGIAYGVPDLDASVRVYVNRPDGDQETVACLEAEVSNGKTVDLLGVKWATAAIAALALIFSAVIAGLGHMNAASHVAANSLSLVAYFQSQAIVGLASVNLPPVVQAWTQNFQWSMGIINVGFMQDMFTWYQRATGGEPSNLFDEMESKSVEVQKRMIFDGGVNLLKRGVGGAFGAATELVKRKNIETETGGYVVYGIQRVAFKAGIETTNLFMTSIAFLIVLYIFTILVVAIFRGIYEVLSRRGWMKSDWFHEFRTGWLIVLKGILFRIGFICFPLVCIMCLWEFTQNDSAAEMVLAVFFLLGVTISLGGGAFKVLRVARRSVTMHRNPAYILFADPTMLNKWGFFYIQYRATAHYYVIPALVYVLVKALFVALSQRNGLVMAVALIIIEAAALIGASVLRPWMDKSTNSFNIAICVVNFLNAVFLLIFTDVFGAPGLVIGAVGVVLFVLNAAFSLILLLMVIISTTVTLFRKNPDTRYSYMGDDRTSFVKSNLQIDAMTELDALAATARRETTGRYTEK